MKELKDILKFLIGFAPWILFLFLSGHTLVSLERSIMISLIASLIFGFKELRKGFLLQWGSFLFFAFCVITVYFFKSIFVMKNMGIISNGFLACLIWGTIFVAKPFTLQYARVELPKERWNEPAVIHTCRFIAIIWALLLTISASVAIFRTLKPGLFPDWVYFDTSIAIMLGGAIFTTLYKKYRRNQASQAT